MFVMIVDWHVLNRTFKIVIDDSYVPIHYCIYLTYNMYRPTY